MLHAVEKEVGFAPLKVLEATSIATQVRVQNG
jgi:hypothetical protein